MSKSHKKPFHPTTQATESAEAYRKRMAATNPAFKSFWNANDGQDWDKVEKESSGNRMTLVSKGLDE